MSPDLNKFKEFIKFRYETPIEKGLKKQFYIIKNSIMKKIYLISNDKIWISNKKYTSNNDLDNIITCLKR